MDEQAIRMWAWEKTVGMTTGKGDERRTLTVAECFPQADEIAAWVMSGKLPAYCQNKSDAD